MSMTTSQMPPSQTTVSQQRPRFAGQTPSTPGGGNTPITALHAGVVPGMFIGNSLWMHVRGRLQSVVYGLSGGKWMLRSALERFNMTSGSLDYYRRVTPELQDLNDDQLKSRVRQGVREALAAFERDGLVVSRKVLGLTFVHTTPLGKTVFQGAEEVSSFSSRSVELCDQFYREQVSGQK